MSLLFAGVVGYLLTRDGAVGQQALSILAQTIFIGTLAFVVAGLSEWNFRQRFTAVLLMVFLGGFVNVAVELTIFSVASSTEIIAIVVLGAIVATVSATLAAWLFQVRALEKSGAKRLSDYFASRKPVNWVVRVAIGVAAYCLAYFIVGSLVYPFVEPYYLSDELGLTVPKLGLVMLVQCIRAPIYIAAVWLFVIGSSYTRKRTMLVTGIALYVLGGLTPLLGAADWPTPLRIYHGVEIFFQNFTAGLIIAWLLLTQQRAGGDVGAVRVPE